MVFIVLLSNMYFVLCVRLRRNWIVDEYAVKGNSQQICRF